MSLITEWAVFTWLLLSGNQIIPVLMYVDDVSTCSSIALELRGNPLPQMDGGASCVNLKVTTAHTTPYMNETSQTTEHIWFNPYWSGGGPLRETEGVNHGWDQMRKSANAPTRADAKIYD